MKLSFVLFASGVAQDGYGGEQSGGEQAESYGQEAGYGEAGGYEYHAPAPNYQPHAKLTANKVCFQGCPKHAPCYGAGGCQPSSCGGPEIHAEESYAAPVEQSYGQAQQSQGGYRRLQGYGEEQQGQQSYGGAEAAPVQQSYSAEAPVGYAAPAKTTGCGCPAGTVDTSHLTLTSPIMLWVAFVLLFLPAFFFLCKGMATVDTFLSANSNPTLAEFQQIQALAFPPSGTGGPVGAFMRDLIAVMEKFLIMPRILVGIVATVAALAYLAMATGHGYVIKCNGRAFYYARYIDWVITTPLMLIDLATFSGFGSTLNTVFLVSMDILMIVAGLIGELVDGGEKWAFFGISMLFFIPVMSWLCTNDAQDGQMCGAAATTTNPFRILFQRTVFITWFTWMFYPIVWILSNTGGQRVAFGASYGGASYTEAQGQQGYRSLQATQEFTAVGVISVTTEAAIYTVLDVIAKTVFGAFITCHSFGIDFGSLIEPVAGEPGMFQVVDTLGQGWQPSNSKQVDFPANPAGSML